MPDTYKDTHKHKTWWALLSILALIALAWSGVLDTQSTQYLDNALLGSGAIYATARGINALVSVLQGTEMNALLVTFTIGELLDPVNDLIERFSGVMMLAIGALALQKILLEVVSHFTFNILLTFLGVGAIATSFLGTPRQTAIVSKCFVVMVIVRFSLALAVLANSWADAIFLQQNETERLEAMQGFHGELSLIGSQAGINTDISSEIQEVEAAIGRNQRAQDAERKELDLDRARLKQAEAELKALDNRSIPEILRGDTTIDIATKQRAIKKLERAIAAHQAMLAAQTAVFEASEEQLDCLRQQSRGASCSLADSVSNAFAAIDLKQQIDALGDQISEFASNIINLLMSLLLKSILLPLLFLYALLRSTRLVFGSIQ